MGMIWSIRSMLHKIEMLSISMQPATLLSYLYIKVALSYVESLRLQNLYFAKAMHGLIA